MKIGLDFDGVISDCGMLKSWAAEKIYGVYIPTEKFKKEIVIGEGLLTADQYRELQQTIYGTREFGLRMRPVSGMIGYIEQLALLGHTICIITSRSDESLDVAKEWSAQKGLQLDFVGVGYNVSKANACKGYDVYVDDDLDKLEDLVDVVPNRFLFSWDYNCHIDEGEIAVRIDSWQRLFETILRL